MKLVEAVDLLLKDSDALGTADPYRYDLVDFTRQILSNYAQEFTRQSVQPILTRIARRLLPRPRSSSSFRDVDTLLASRREFLFGKWLADARSFAATPEERQQYAWDAAMLVTIWGPAADRGGERIEIFDYSWREWSGLINEYYLPRWQKFHAMLARSIDRGDYRDPASQVYGRESLRANGFYSELADWEIAFTRRPPRNLLGTAGRLLAPAKQMLEKYRPALKKVYVKEKEGR